MLTAQRLINKYNLIKHPEGGFYKQSYRSNEVIKKDDLPERFAGDRVYSTAIYYLLRGKDFSAFHRIKSDELWHFYYGTTLNIYVINPQGNLEIIKLGKNIEEGEQFQAVVKAGCWFAARLNKAKGFCFVGCTVAPGFEFEDFELAKAKELIQHFPQHQSLLLQLCR